MRAAALERVYVIYIRLLLACHCIYVHIYPNLNADPALLSKISSKAQRDYFLSTTLAITVVFIAYFPVRVSSESEILERNWI